MRSRLRRVEALAVRPHRLYAMVREGASLIVAEIGKVLGPSDFIGAPRCARTVRFELVT